MRLIKSMTVGMVATPLIPALGRKKKVDLCTDSLVYEDSSRTTRTMEKPHLKKAKL